MFRGGVFGESCNQSFPYDFNERWSDFEELFEFGNTYCFFFFQNTCTKQLPENRAHTRILAIWTKIHELT